MDDDNRITLDNLKPLPFWVGHKDKVPMSPNTGKAALTNTPSTWNTAASAWAAKGRYGWDGIGYVFTIGMGIIGIDLDHCFDDSGFLLSWAADVITCLNSYTERSPSGNGVHIFVRGEIPRSIQCQIEGGGAFEMYNELRYFTVTGNSMHVNPFIEKRQLELDALFVTFGGDFEQRPLPTVKTDHQTSEGDIANALRVMPIHGDYATYWLKVLMAVHDAFPDERGVSLVEAWSPGKNGEVRRKFLSFDRTSKSGVTIASLFHMAKEYGWQPKQRQQQQTRRSGSYDLRGAL